MSPGRVGRRVARSARSRARRARSEREPGAARFSSPPPGSSLASTRCSTRSGLTGALDGVCAGKSFLPHQLVALGVFTHLRPIPGLPTAGFGSSLDELHGALGAAEGEGLLQIATETYALRGGEVSHWGRLRREAPRIDEGSVSRAVELAERHIIAAQRENGAFRYTLDPFYRRGRRGSGQHPPPGGHHLRPLSARTRTAHREGRAARARAARRLPSRAHG